MKLNPLKAIDKAIGFYISVNGSQIKSWLQTQYAKQKIEVEVHIDGKHREMTFKEFKARLLKPIKKATS